MIRQLHGTIVAHEATSITILVSGVGYLVATPQPEAFPLGAEVTIHTYLAVRETALDLYGFTSTDQLALFELLLTIPKVGPKSALQILTQADLPLITTAITNHDPTHLSKLSGIGKKTAEKIVHELHDKFIERFGTTQETTTTQSGIELTEVMEALMSLGYTQSEARDIAQKLPPDITSTTAAVTYALQNMHTGK